MYQWFDFHEGPELMLPPTIRVSERAVEGSPEHRGMPQGARWIPTCKWQTRSEDLGTTSPSPECNIEALTLFTD